MTFGSAMSPPGALASLRFFRTGYLPTYAAAAFLLVLIWAGAPNRPVDFRQAWRTADHIGTLPVLLLVLAVTLVAVLLQPLQLSVVRVLEGEFPRWLGSSLSRNIQVSRKKRLRKGIQNEVAEVANHFKDPRPDRAAPSRQPLDAGSIDATDAAMERLQRAGTASARLRSRFPLPDPSVRPTALGNALAAMEDAAGAAYGLDAAVIWPRLYPLLGDHVRAIVDDLRDGLDAAARLAATAALTAAATLGLLAWHSGWLTLLALLPLAIALLAYVGAIHAATSYGAAVQVAFDLHRFDLLRALRLPLPKDQEDEKAMNRALSDFLRQAVPMPLTFKYADPAPSETPVSPRLAAVTRHLTKPRSTGRLGGMRLTSRLG